MAHLIRENTSPGSAKVTLTLRPNIPDVNKIRAEDWELFRQSLLDVQEYLRGGNFDTPTTHTLKDVNLVLNTDPAVAPELDFWANRGRWFIGIDVANPDEARDMVLIGQRGSYVFTDGVTTSGSPTLTSAARGGFTSALVGVAISGAGIPAATTVIAVAGPTSLTLSANATATASGVTVTITRTSNVDLIYVRHRGAQSPTVGVGVTPPDGSARLQVAANDAEPTMGTIRLRVGSAQTANALTVHSASPTDRFWVDSAFYVSGEHPLGGAVVLKGNTLNNRPLLLIDKDLAASVYGFEYPSGGGGVLRFVRTTTAVNVFQVGTDGTLFFYNGATFQSNVTYQSNLTVQRAVLFSNELTVAAFGTTPQNNFTITNLDRAYDLFVSASIANVDITGITTGAAGRELYVYNNGASNTVTLKHLSGSSTAANQIIGRGNADVVLNPAQGVLLRYSAGSTTKWIVRHAP